MEAIEQATSFKHINFILFYSLGNGQTSLSIKYSPDNNNRYYSNSGRTLDPFKAFIFRSVIFHYYFHEHSEKSPYGITIISLVCSY